MSLPARSHEDVHAIRPEFERGRRLTDVGNAERFAMQHGKDVRYIAPWNRWAGWDGKRFSIDDNGVVVRCAKATVVTMYAEAADAADRAERRAIAQHAASSEKESRIRAMISLASSDLDLQVRPSELDADPWALNVANGIIDLRTGALLPHSRTALCTKIVPIPLDATARCPRWVQFLEEIFAGDSSLVGFIQRMIGYSLTGLTNEQCFVLLVGVGANGKTTLLEIARRLLGEYATQADFATFLERIGHGPRNDVARLFGARIVTSSEVGEGKRFDESLVKTLTGDEKIAARRLYQEAFEFHPTFKLWLAANHRPEIRGTDLGIWRRIRLVPFDVVIPEHQRDRNLLDTLVGELPGILAWALDGCLAWQREGLGTPAIVRTATDEYRADSDAIGTFLEECCETDSTDSSLRERASSLYEAYSAWSLRNGNRPTNGTVFGRRLGALGFRKSKNGNGFIERVGVGLRAQRANRTDSSGSFLESPHEGRI